MTRNRFTKHDFYRGSSPSEAPSYFLAEAAHYLRVPASTIRNWVHGKSFTRNGVLAVSRPFVEIADPKQEQLSFLNLAELQVLNSLRRIHLIQSKYVWRAIEFLRSRYCYPHPLIGQAMLTDGKHVFIERYGELANISCDGQLHMKQALNIYLRRIQTDRDGIPIKLFPFTRDNVDTSPMLVSINPCVRSGKPCIAGTGIPTRIISQRHAAGDSIRLLTRDYGRPTKEIEEAIRYESGKAS